LRQFPGTQHYIRSKEEDIRVGLVLDSNVLEAHANETMKELMKVGDDIIDDESMLE
jgi:hypothetical protein